jgi:hypothetical protein
MAFITTIVLASIFLNSLNIFATLLTDPLPATAYRDPTVTRKSIIAIVVGA